MLALGIVNESGIPYITAQMQTFGNDRYFSDPSQQIASAYRAQADEIHIGRVMAGLPFIFGYNAIVGILRGLGESRRPLLFICIAAAINVVLDVVFVAAFHWDAAGTALATVFSQIGSFAAAAIFIYRSREHFDLEINRNFLKIDGEISKIIFKLAIPQVARSMTLYAHPRLRKRQAFTDDLSRDLRENLTGIRVIRAYNAEQYQEQKFEQADTVLTVNERKAHHGGCRETGHRPRAPDRDSPGRDSGRFPRGRQPGTGDPLTGEWS